MRRAPAALLALALAAGPGPARAEVDPAEVWDGIGALADRAGLVLSPGDVAIAPDAVAVSDLVIRAAPGGPAERLGAIEIAVPALRIDATESPDGADGAATLALPEEIPFTLRLARPEGDLLARGTLDARMARIRVSDAPDGGGRLYAFDADRIALSAAQEPGSAPAADRPGAAILSAQIVRLAGEARQDGAGPGAALDVSGAADLVSASLDLLFAGSGAPGAPDPWLRTRQEIEDLAFTSRTGGGGGWSSAQTVRAARIAQVADFTAARGAAIADDAPFRFALDAPDLASRIAWRADGGWQSEQSLDFRALRYDLSADPDAPASQAGLEELALAIGAFTLRSSLSRTADGLLRGTQNGRTEALGLKLAVTEKGLKPFGLSLRGTLAALDLAADYAIPPGLESDDPAEVLAAVRDSLFVRGELSAGPYAAAGRVAADGVDGAFAATSDGSRAALSVERGGVRYEGEALRTTSMVSGGPLALPELSYSIARARAAVTTPPLDPDRAQPFRLDYEIRDLSLSDGVWSLFDPDGVLSREPLTLLIGLGGEVLLPGAMFERPPSGPPAVPELREVTLDTFRITASGAEIAGEGALRADPGGAVISPDLPPMRGGATFTATGLNALLDGLVTVGLILPENAAMARAALGYAAIPSGPDSYRSEITAGPDGLLANGVPLR